MQSTAEIRASFLTFFQERGHELVASSPLVPANDPTLLFTNAGMVPFKEAFTGKEKRSVNRATSSQRCVRAGGKHNDLENVGYTARHHTFFEMLGNFSFGDYFKREAIEYSWEFLTRKLGLDPERLFVTVFEEDDEAADIWLKEIGVSEQHFARIGARDNFWSMGDTGPCGPCSEIFYDHGADIPGGPPGTADEDGDRFIEIWNLVFMQYDRDADGNMTPLPKPSVDTGMGLERLVAILQGVHDNYDIDLFKTLIAAIAKIAATDDLQNRSLRVIADHIRSCAFLITDGVLPSNEGRGYVLRRIIRRAARHGHRLGLHRPFFYTLVETLDELMGDAYPELRNASGHVARVLQQEEERFAETLDNGMSILEATIADLSGKTIDGETVFKLYDTFGFPVDLTADIARERGLQLDMAGFESLMEQQRQRARAASQFETDTANLIEIKGGTEFTGYEQSEDEATVVSIFKDLKEPVNSIKQDELAIVVLDRTPFYAESGGQVGDQGSLSCETNQFSVETTKKHASGAFLHLGRMGKGILSVGDKVQARVWEERDSKIRLNHSATHLMHAALREVLGDHVAQKGSLVNAGYLRFDFSHNEPVSPEQLAEIETMVNEQIRANLAVEAREMSLDEARATGAMALFGEKYGNSVTVLSMGEFSRELCGGTHVKHTGDIGLFKIESESGIASGVRRIEAVTGDGALLYVSDQQQQLGNIAGMLKTNTDQVQEKVHQLLNHNRNLEKELEQLKGRLASAAGGDLAGQAEDVNGLKVLAARLDGADARALRDTLDQLKNKLGQAAVVLAAVNGDKVALVAGVTSEHMNTLKAGELVNFVAQQVGGKGGGRADMAQAGGKDPSKLDEALASVKDWVRQQLTE
ncbi:MAG: alanine--tRNA ligase [Gammaproteobacteria bacterium]|nr:MAG: alanine--tRNA ligase [Gammaproteobacteria bacterium]